MTSSDELRIGFIGIGVMGCSMAGHLMAAGHRLTIHTRSRSKADSLIDRGATWADSSLEAANGSDVAISMVGFPDDVAATHLGPLGTLQAPSPPPLIIDMSTSRPSLAVQIADHARARNVMSVDAPVSGGDVGARNATLSIMAGGEAAAFARAEPILRLLGKIVIRHGGPGAGQHAKMVNQILIASNMIGVCEGLLYAATAGLDPAQVIESVGAGAAGSWSINNLGPRILRRDFNPGFFVDHFIKDLGIAIEEANRMGLELPGLALARRLYQSVQDDGHGRLGTQALMLTLERLCAVPLTAGG